MLRLFFSFAVLAGMGSGGYFSLQSSIVAQIVGSHRVGPAIGAIELVSSIGQWSYVVNAVTPLNGRNAKPRFPGGSR